MRNKYTLSEFLYTGYCFIRTKIFYTKSRLIRFPFYLRGKKSLTLGKNLTTGYRCRLDLNGKEESLIIGDNCEFGDYVHIVALKKIEIGNNVLIASKVFISDTSHGSYKGNEQSNAQISPKERRLVSEEVFIEDNVWIGENVVILSGVRIGKGAIVGSNSVITKNVPSEAIVVGTPGRVIKTFNHVTQSWVCKDKI